MKMLFLSLLLLISPFIFADDRIKIAVIDTGIILTDEIKPYLCKDESFDFTNQGIKDINGHGTNIAHIISEGLDKDKYCIMILKWYHNENIELKEAEKLIFESVSYAIFKNASYINMSLSGGNYLKLEYTAIKAALNKGIKVIVAAGNNGKKLVKNASTCDVFPACYNFKSKNFRVVANYIGDQRNPTSNYGNVITDKVDGYNKCTLGICMTGTSQSAAALTKRLINNK